MDPLILMVYIYFAVNYLIREENITLSDIFVDYTNDNEDNDILGNLHITDFIISGLETITNDLSNINATEDENENNNACMYLPIANLQFTARYVADIRVANEIPFYGDAKILFTLNNIDLTVCAFFDNNKGLVDNVTSHFSYRNGPVEFIGFWKNKQISEILEKLLNFANIFYSTWSKYEPDRAGCLINPLLQYVINSYKGYENNTLSFDTTLSCLQGLSTDNGSDYGSRHYLLTPMEIKKNADTSL